MTRHNLGLPFTMREQRGGQKPMTYMRLKMRLVSFVEVYEISLLNRAASEIKYALREVLINPEHVVAIRENLVLKDKLQKGCFPEDLDQRQDFAKLQLNLGSGQSSVAISIVGDIHTVASRLVPGSAE